MDYRFSSLKNFVVKEAPLQGTKMQRINIQQALEMILDGANPCDSDGKDINLQMDSDSELSQSSSDEETAPQPKKRARLGTDVTETAKDGTVWHEEQAIFRVPSLRDCWSKNLGSQHIIETMSRGRFQNIMHHLRFDDRDTRSERAQTDKFAAISNIWGLFVTNCITSYIPGRHITIDEQLFPSKTRCCFLQYSKPDKFGIKFWVACDLKTKYVCNILPYLGKDPTRPRGERVSESVVMRLMEPFLDEGRNVTTDNFFTSLSLAKRLLSRNTTILGTVNKIRQEIPLSTRQMHRNEFTTQVFSTTGATLTVYAPKRKKTVYVLSSMHSMIQTQDTTKKKPNTITLYNTTKCGVDVMDQMVREYTVRAGTRRWPVAVFYNMIDMAALNAHVLYQLCTGRQERRVEFLLELARELAQIHKGGDNREAGREKDTARSSHLTTCIMDYINFCVENTVPTRKVRCFPNNKPWVTPDLKAPLNEKKRVFRSGDKEELRRVQKELRRGIRRGKDSYRRKLEERLKGSNAREVWRGLKTISGHTKDSGRGPESGGLD
ncbi:hypothetical protein D4764_14G0000490 [Takifugu flavidus]|uniref:PiggyBac transposable element-derived protein domain-containing protein n=1 Tax=Takifugu flavidus TaxID=433684 RepID=A0A5C6P5E2_9TELE|nr:hypothetical protein D4764_14G0000490 [Takifugu flavidus]